MQFIRIASAVIKLYSKYFWDLLPGKDVKKYYQVKINLAGLLEDP